MYSVFISKFQNKPSPNIYFKNPFNDYIDWTAMYMLSRLVTYTTLTPQTVSFGFLDSVKSDSIFENNKDLSNHTLLIFKLYVYMSREKKLININSKSIEKEIVLTNSKKTIAFSKKRQIITSFHNIDGSSLFSRFLR